MSDSERRPRVLVVDDEPDLADLYADYLGADYAVETVYSGQAAVDGVDDDVDVLLLDRRMPVTSGNETVAAVEERGADVRVALVTAVDPDFDIIELRIDDYLVKPVQRAELRETVGRLLGLEEYSTRVQTLSAKRLKRNVLQVEKPEPQLRDSAEFERLTEEIDRLEAEVESLAEDLELDDESEYR